MDTFFLGDSIGYFQIGNLIRTKPLSHHVWTLSNFNLVKNLEIRLFVGP